ncbi:MAG: Rrf2 family transcriptional regulator [Myxococcota bacterium]|nr:Rrf2 family transcriptional regulator [Myxococcota bacterium]MDW8361137.1 Rrf2 family transcriptional regulator [Myxococcales bacterium]
MKLSNRGRYGVQAVFDVAFHNEGRPTQIKDIAARQGIPPRFLEQIFQDLKRAGIVESRRGPRGGYRLARPASEIRIGDVLRALEGPLWVEEPVGAAVRRGAGDPASRALLEEVFRGIGERVEACFDAVTIGAMCERAEAAGVRRAGRIRLAYAI